MADVVIPGQSQDDLWLRSLPVEARARFLYPSQPPPTEDHRTGVRVGVMGMAMQCLTCGTVCMPRHEPMELTDQDTGRTWTIPGAWVGPPDDPYSHLFPFRAAPAPTEATETPASRTPAPTFGSDRTRPAGLPAGVPRRTDRAPSRSRKGRMLEKRRERAKQRGEPITMDMFMSTRAYIRWRRKNPTAAVEEPVVAPKVERPKFVRRRKAVEPAEPYAETETDELWQPEDEDDDELADTLAEAEASLARLRAIPDAE